MQEIVFGPYWNVPTSIKVEEIRPISAKKTLVLRRRRMETQFSGATASASDTAGRKSIRAQIDWNQVDIRNLEIFQPPGPDNVCAR